MKKIRTGLALIMVLLPAIIYAGGSREKPEASGKLNIVATTTIITDVVGRIAGDKAEVKGLMKKGQDPHSYDPTPRDMALVEKADMIFVNGFDLEENLLSTLNNNTSEALVEVSHGITPPEEEDQEAEHEEHHDGHDGHNHEQNPHTWMSLKNVMIWADNITEALSEHDPENAAYYASNRDFFKAELEKLHHNYEERFDALPEGKRYIVTDHNVFGYLARDYHLHVAGTIIPGFSSQSENTVKELAELVDLMNRRNIDTLFIGETSGNAVEQLTKTISGELGREIGVIPVLTGSLAADGEKGDTYIGFMQYNLNQILKGLE